MYNFVDKDGKNVTLRPEMTPSLARMILSLGGKVLLLPHAHPDCCCPMPTLTPTAAPCPSPPQLLPPMPTSNPSPNPIPTYPHLPSPG